MRWSDVLFLHWEVQPSTVRSTLPSGLGVDMLRGSAYLGIVAFDMEELSPLFAPSTGELFTREFAEVNLRTYVIGPDGRRGIYFYSLDADDRLSVIVANSLFGLPYEKASMRLEWEDGMFSFCSSREISNGENVRFEAEYKPERGVEVSSRASSFLTERYLFYFKTWRGLRVGRVRHDQWSLCGVDGAVINNDLFASNQFEEPSSNPTMYYSDGVSVVADWPSQFGLYS